jgi:hypothetical protein
MSRNPRVTMAFYEPFRPFGNAVPMVFCHDSVRGLVTMTGIFVQRGG